jgi:hypothetical protein
LGLAFVEMLGVEGGWFGSHGELRDVIDDATMNALFDQEAKQNQSTLSLNLR